jgi:hypothetical protein
MPLPKLNLDDRSYAQLVDEARTLIPVLDRRWTNHNPSDPGIMLIELLAWLVEMVIYRTNQVPDESVWKFLRLLNGGETPEWLGRPIRDLPLAEAVRRTVLNLRQPYRAVTARDYEQLVGAWRAPVDAPQVARVCAIPGQNMEARDAERAQADHISLLVLPQAIRTLDPIGETSCPTFLELYADSRPHTVSIGAQWSPAEIPLRFELASSGDDRIVDPRWYRRPPVRWDVPADALAPDRAWSVYAIRPAGAPITGALTVTLLPPQPSEQLREALWQWLDVRRLLAVRHHVVGPAYVPLTIEAELHLDSDAQFAQVRGAAEAALRERFDPIAGGADGQGWPLGRHIFLSEVNEVLVAVPGVAYVHKLTLSTGAQTVVSEEGKSDKDTLIRLREHTLVDLKRSTIHEHIAGGPPLR